MTAFPVEIIVRLHSGIPGMGQALLGKLLAWAREQQTALDSLFMLAPADLTAQFGMSSPIWKANRSSATAKTAITC